MYEEGDDDNMEGGNYIFSGCCGGLKINQHSTHTFYRKEKNLKYR